MSSYQFESSSPPSLSSSISSLSSISSSESSPQSSFISSYFNKESSDAIIGQRQQQLQLQLKQQQQNHNHRSQQCHHPHCQQHHSSRNAQNNNNPLMVVDQIRAKTKNEDYDYSILNIIPNLISEKKKKTMFVEKLVEMTCHIIGIIWADDPNSKDIPLKTFVQETLRRSRTSYSTLQATLFYLFRIREKISHQNNSITDRHNHNHNNGNGNGNSNKPAACCRRMFLAALIVASKYLQDCNYSNRAWSRVTGLPIKELNSNEICFLRLIDYNLFISENNFKHWSSMLLKYIQETLYIPGMESRKNPIDNNNNNNNNYHHHLHHRLLHHPHNHPFINNILENQYSIIRLREIMKSMDEFEGLTQRPGCQNNNNNNNSPINYHQNCKYVRTMAN